MSERTIYLASASPRRRQLVQALGVPVVAGLAPFDEDAATAAYVGDSGHLAEHLARAKAEATILARDELPTGGVVVAADTTVLLDGRSLAKPRDEADAGQMLRLLRNRTHQVTTAVALAAPSEPVRALGVTTEVAMRDYTDAEISTYVASDDPFDKAGAYAIQHEGFHPVKAIEGCYLAVVGLPLCALAHLLATAEDASEADRGRASRQEAAHRTGRCPWSSACRPPLPRWEAPSGDLDPPPDR